MNVAMSETIVAISGAAEAFLFPCPSCHKAIDALTAPWCLCLVRQPSVVCPSCQSCLCQAEKHVSRDFWKRAPASVIARNVAERQLRASRGTITGNFIDVLVVDDHEETRTVAASMIQEMGYSVLTANDAADALKLMETVRPSLVLTDALMPKVDGRHLCRFIKADFPSVGVVIMTALYTSTRYQHEALKTYHADDYVAKPIDFHRLSDVLSRLIPRKLAAAA